MGELLAAAPLVRENNIYQVEKMRWGEEDSKLLIRSIINIKIQRTLLRFYKERSHLGHRLLSHTFL